MSKMKSPTTAIDPASPEFTYRTLWAVYGPSRYWPSILCCTVNHRSGVETIWGYSVWKGNPGFRTLGIDLGEWMGRYEMCFFFEDQQHAFDFLKVIMAPKAIK